MSDERMRSALEMWFEDTDPQSPDPQKTAAQVLAQVPQTRQRGRWLPFAVLGGTKGTSVMTTDTSEYQPSPIPATNGHTPTVIGRTQTMLSPVKAITAGALVFALGGVMLITQPFEQQGGTVPGAAVADPGPAAYVQGTMVGGSCCGDEAETFDDEGNRLTLRGMVTSGVVDMDDPRLSGVWEQTISVDEFPQLDTDERVEVHWGELTISNDGGTWAGTWTSTYDSAAPTETELIQYRLTGEGEYEGLSALLSPTRPGWPSWTIAGAIFPGPLPPDSAYDD